MKKLTTLILIISLYISAAAQQPRVIHFDRPQVDIFTPPAGLSNGKAVICCPGGGYSIVAKEHEGYDWAPFFNRLGYTFAVVDYRLPEGDRTIPMSDISATYDILCDSASVWHIDPRQIGIMGFSAGGHLASAVATHPSESRAISFQILFYPVASLDAAITHSGTRHGFLGHNDTDDLAAEYSAENKVCATTPPAIFLLSADDTVVDPDNSLRYFNALRKASVPATMHIYPSGGHGWGYNSDFRYHRQMLYDLTNWLENL